jgi:hypothetical protein
MTTSLKSPLYWSVVDAKAEDFYTRTCEDCDYKSRIPMLMIMHRELKHFTPILPPE